LPAGTAWVNGSITNAKKTIQAEWFKPTKKPEAFASGLL
jgi:hypothetical protein